MKRLPAPLSGLAAAVAIAWGLAAGVGPAQAQTQAGTAARDFDRAASLVPGALACRELTPQGLTQLTLLDTVQHVLCKSPLLNQALQAVNEQQAGIDLAQSAYRPRYTVSAEFATNRIPTSDSGAGSSSSSFTGSLGVSWVVYDAGGRAANLAQSRLQLTSAQAAQKNAALNVLNQALQLYVDAATAWARLAALRETEAVARQSLQAAQAKHEAMVGSLSEKLQAQTALAQATLDRVRADGTWETARGLLAQAMGFPVSQRLTLAPVDTAFPVATMTPASDKWLEDARREHPRVRGIKADILALQSRLDSIRSEYKGNVQLSAGLSSNRDLSTPNSRFDKRLNGSLYASIPIFSQSELQAREGQTLAQIASREAAMAQVERDVEAEIWRNARQLETEAQNFEAARQLVAVASQSYDITFGRYKAGVGSILELISTQAALSTARAQLTQAQLGFAQAQLKLEVAAGRMVIGQ